ncbi:phosphoribosyltransferase [Nakamurella flavida]|uniref:Phosphoribosyltransferase n=1 Tax=Nakamurella flavida TaxID=363630 RepID=A0A938YRB7_9ACTN|nr:phosphoribosyltransferase [Nakamurella flavida]MBM9477803.1 phosphoribosyltransferase [Nakamurella flavida]MDP9779356.1 hypoxanthine phosphoribosyltransferase [Nakamurella flavida]
MADRPETPVTDDAAVTAATAPVREVLGWGQFGEASRELAHQVADSGFDAEIVLAIARGGLVPAGALSYALGLKAAGTLNVEFYTDIETTLPDPIVLEPLLDTNAIVGKRLLVVDDVADSGRTLALVMDLVRGHGAEARSAVLYTKPRTIVQPDFSWRETDRWITFPWSALPPVKPSALPPVKPSAQ